MTADSIGLDGGVGLYGYVGGDPVNLADIEGLEPPPEPIPVDPKKMPKKPGPTEPGRGPPPKKPIKPPKGPGKGGCKGVFETCTKWCDRVCISRLKIGCYGMCFALWLACETLE